MYIYFDTNGTIKEIVNDKSIRQGSTEANKIYCYIEGNPTIDDIWYMQKLPSGETSNEVSFKNSTVTKAIPYDAKRDMRYFKDFEQYTFYVFTLNAFLVSQKGLNLATIRIVVDNEIFALGELTFNVQENVINVDNGITISQYDYLLLAYASRTLNEVTANDLNTLLDDKINAKIGDLANGSPKVFDTEANIEAMQDDEGIAVATDTGYIYVWNDTQEQYISTGMKYIADVSLFYTKTEIDNKLDLKADKSEVTPTLQSAYIGQNKPIYYTYSGATLTLYVYGNLNIVINNSTTNVTLSTINNDYPSKTTLSNNVLTITLSQNESLVFNKINNHIEITSTITNDMIVLVKNGSGQIIGGVLYYKIINSELDNIFKEYVTQFYPITSYTPIIEEAPNTNNPIYFTFNGNMNIRVGATKTCTISSIASEVNTTLVTSPSGIANCIQINDSRSLVFNLITGSFELITRTDIKKYHINLLSGANGVAVGGLFIDSVNRIKNSYEAKIQIYIANGLYPYIESDLVNKKIYFSFYQIASRLSFTNDSTLSVSELATELGVNLVTSPEGYSNCIEIPNDYSLVFNICNSKYRLIPRANVTFLDIVLIANIAGRNIKGIFISYKDEFINNNDYHNIIPIKDKATELDTYINNSTENDLYLFFTDPHSQPKTTYYDKLLATISKYDKSIPFDFVLCGGDWLLNSDTPTEAKYRLGYISQSFKSNCTDYHQLLGNHDTNYQGTETLNNQTLVNIYNRKENSNYYSFKTNNTTYYCLDTGSDWVTTMDAYRWTQIGWLANKLLTEDVKHSVIALHIYWNSGTTLSDMATNLNSLIVAYNTRTSVTLNSITYNFNNCTGHIEYVISGHTHADMNDKIGTIPVFSSLNTTVSGVICFDMVYADYDNRVLTLVRVGSGSNRQFDLDTGDRLDVVSDTTTAYTKTVPSGAIGCQINKIGGMSYKTTNLMVPVANTSGTAGGVTYTISNGVVTLNGTSTGTEGFWISLNTTVTAGEYYFKIFNPINQGRCFIRLDNAGTSAVALLRDTSTGTRVTLSEGEFKVFFWIGASGLTFNNLVIYPMLVSGTTAPTEYQTYFEGIRDTAVTSVVSKDSNDTTIDTLTIPTAIKNLTGYGWGINENCYNYIDFDRKVFVQKVVRVLAKDLNWQTDTTNRFFAIVRGLISTLNTRDTNVLCAEYTTNTDGSDMTIFTFSQDTIGEINRILIYDSHYNSNPTDFKNHFTDDDYIYYELVTPIETDISAYLTTDTIDVEPLGTLEFTNTYSQDVPSDIDYLIEEMKA